METGRPFICYSPIAFGLIGIAAAPKKFKANFVAPRDTIFPFQSAPPKCFRFEFLSYKSLEQLVCSDICVIYRYFKVFIVLGEAVAFHKIYLHILPHAILLIPPPKLCTIMLPNSLLQSSSLFQT